MKFLLGILILGLLSFTLAGCSVKQHNATPQLTLTSEKITLIEMDGLRFRDLNRNNLLDPYEDWRLSSEQRAKDLAAKMTLPEKIGQLLHGSLFPDYSSGKPSSEYTVGQLKTLVLDRHITALIPFFDLTAQQFAQENNKVQGIAEGGRLGIPVMISTDPRHHFQGLTGASQATEGFSRWPETLGLAAIDDPGLTRRFAEIASSEYRATGFTLALSPMADLATEPRWPRIYGTFGENPSLAARMVAAYIEGFQGGTSETDETRAAQPEKVATVVKHWVGYGAAKDGFDSHNYYGRYADLTSEDLPAHILPFEAAFRANVSSVMPAYSIFDGLTLDNQEVEPVASAYSSVLLKGLLRNQYGFDGVVLSDWAITNDCSERCRNGAPAGQRPSVADISTGWGVQDLTRSERFALAMRAGVDQFGGADDPAPLLQAVVDGLVSLDQIDQSLHRVLMRSFDVGLFENPFVDLEKVDSLVNLPEASAMALAAQSRAMVVLKQATASPVLDSSINSIFLYVPGSDSKSPNEFAKPYLEAGYHLVDSPEKADLIIARLSAPYETLHPGYFFGSSQHEGSLEFPKQGEILSSLSNFAELTAPLVVDVFMDRPAILTQINELADVLIVNFGASDTALINALTGLVPAEGKLPFELPRSASAVEQQSSGTPSDSTNPLYPFGYRFSQDEN